MAKKKVYDKWNKVPQEVRDIVEEINDEVPEDEDKLAEYLEALEEIDLEESSALVRKRVQPALDSLSSALEDEGGSDSEDEDEDDKQEAKDSEFTGDKVEELWTMCHRIREATERMMEILNEQLGPMKERKKKKAEDVVDEEEEEQEEETPKTKKKKSSPTTDSDDPEIQKLLKDLEIAKEDGNNMKARKIRKALRDKGFSLRGNNN